MGIVYISGDSSAKFALRSPGWYDLRIVEVSDFAKDGKAPSNRIVGQILASENNTGVGETMSGFMSHAPWNANRWRQLLENASVAFEVVPGPDGEGLRFDPMHLVGRIVRVLVVHNRSKKDGKTYENWDEFAYLRFAQQGVPQQPQQLAPQAHPPVVQHQAGYGNPPPVRQ